MPRTAHVLLLLCALAALLPLSALGEDAFYTEMPPYLRFTQQTTEQAAGPGATIRRTVPATANPAVDEEMAALLDALLERSRPQLDAGTRSAPVCLDVGAVISRSGESCLSFLAIAEVSRVGAQLSVDFDTRVYDMETGRRIALSDVFPEGSEAWALLSQAVDAQLRDAFPGVAPDEERLAALCAPDALRGACFTLGAAQLTLTYRADSVYPGRNTLLHVRLGYPQLRPLMTEWAQRQTDNSRFRMVALTYDDGPARVNTRRVLDELRAAGAQATFFMVGRNVERNPETVCRQQDAGHSLQSHSFTHKYPDRLSTEQIMDERQRVIDAMAAVTGVAPTMMRAPGGMDAYYVRRAIGYPLIHWSLAAGDSGTEDYKRVASRLTHNVTNGDIVLMHDINDVCWRYTRSFLEYLQQNGFLCVTVEELFIHTGVALVDNAVYFSPFRFELAEEADEKTAK
ncbi:MAG: polysaccharide deacetylase family protein [Candidatus Ventricola sp.]